MLLTRIVHQTKHASTENVKIPVLASVESMLTAGSETMFPFVSVTRDTSETPSPTATDQSPHLYDPRLLIPADQVPVESMLNVEREMEQLPVPVSLVYLEIHMLNASQNAQSTLNVQWIKPVSDRSVWIPVLESVAPMQDVLFKITTPVVLVTQDTLETHSDSAPELQRCQFPQKLSIPASLRRVDPMLFVMRETELLPASVYQNTLETPTSPADQSVLSILTALQTKHANKCIARILALVLVVSMPFVEFRTTSLLVLASRTTLGILSLHVN